MTKKISQLPAATIAALANELEINEAGTSKKVTGTQLSTLFEAATQTLTNKTMGDDLDFGGFDAKNLTDVAINQQGKVIFDFDTASSTFIRETSNDRLDINVGGQTGIRMDEIGTEIDVIIGVANVLATTATSGFLNIPTSAGTPTGVPVAYTGKVAMEYDTTNDILYVYNGSWKGVELT